MTMVKISVAKGVAVLLLLETISIADCSKGGRFQGLYSGKVKNYEVVVPVKVTEEGRETKVLRHRRSSGGVRYRLNIAGKRQEVELSPSTNFLARGLIVEGGRGSRPRRPHATDCHYTGTILGQPHSTVALSACHDGLVGLIRNSNEEYWIEPVKTYNSTDFKPHLLYKRARHQPTRHGKKFRNRKRKKKTANCGTREPRRKTLPSLAKKKVVWIRKKSDHKDQSRARRSVSKERHVEVLVVADTSMVNFHRENDLETYLLTIMNMVSSTYQDPSIGNYINIVVVRIILLEDDIKEGLNITVNADTALKNFCKWQMERNPTEDEHPNHHDVAILVTRKDICARKNVPCSTLGVSQVGGMCQPDRSCNLNEDNGITLAHTITHELGHNFGMYHDTPQAGCEGREASVLHVMTPNFEADTTHIAWSGCSRRDITHFLDQGMGHCLDDLPNLEESYTYPDLPPGAMYNADHQCKLQFGTFTATVCSPLEEICSRLWCLVDGTCSSMLYPAATGTHCGKFKWCLNQECVEIGERPEGIHGEWGGWSGWSPCSRSCGGGVSTRERHCNNPVPAFGGKFCVGERQKYKVCNTQPCPEDTPSFRTEQCSVYNENFLEGMNVTFKPHFEKEEPCNLYCSESGGTLIEPFGDSALDGTPCNLGTHDMCIGGICRKVGCDWVVDSHASEDQCGICHGDGSQCKTIRGEYNNKITSGNAEILKIPENARNIFLEERGSYKNFFISLQSSSKKKYYLNGKRESFIPGEFDVAGAIGLYDYRREKEKIKIPGPIREPIVVLLMRKGKNHNSAVYYEYTVLKEVTVIPKKYEWEYEWSACSKSCGGGIQSRSSVCMDTQLHQRVNEEMCGDKPSNMSRSCNVFSCPTRWWVGPWQPCPVSCGRGVKRRTVICVTSGKNQTMAVLDSACGLAEQRPPETAPCARASACPQPHAHHLHLHHHNLNLNHLSPPSPTSSKWLVRPWEPCSATCGPGLQRRLVICSQFSMSCHQRTKPLDLRFCFLADCPSPKVDDSSAVVIDTYG